MKKAIIALLLICPLLTSCRSMTDGPDGMFPTETEASMNNENELTDAGDYYADGSGRVWGFNSDNDVT